MVFLITYLSSLSFDPYWVSSYAGFLGHMFCHLFRRYFFLTISYLTTKYDEHWRRLELWRKVLSTQKMEYAGREGLHLDGHRPMLAGTSIFVPSFISSWFSFYFEIFTCDFCVFSLLELYPYPVLFLCNSWCGKFEQWLVLYPKLMGRFFTFNFLIYVFIML